MEIDLDKMHKNAPLAAKLLRTLAHKDRLLILCQLLAGEMCAGDLWKNSSLSQSAFSQHLAVLRRDGLVKTRKESQTVYYALGNQQSTTILNALHDIYCKPSKFERTTRKSS